MRELAHSHAVLIKRFYERMQARDAEAMAACYHDEGVFEDPVFGRLDANEARAMWTMLLSRATDLEVRTARITADDENGRAEWTATYTLQRGRRVIVNRITARFRFQDGRIVHHRDTFSLWRWSRMALGPLGTLLGWTPLVRGQIRRKARRGLERHMVKDGGV